jgi:hypothetical protein
LHSRLRPVGSNVIIELRKGRQHDMVMAITGKPAQVIDDQELHTTSVLSTETQKAL